MILCPNCKAENRSGAKFCKNCALQLPDSPAATRPLELPADPPQPEPESTSDSRMTSVTRRLGQISRSGTRPLGNRLAFLARPAGAIFGESYLYLDLQKSSAEEHRYKVRLLDLGQEIQVRVCPNPDCGAIFPPRHEAPEQFCTDCGRVVERFDQDLILIETPSPLPDCVVRTASKGLSHSGVRAPLTTFVEYLAGQPHHCLIHPVIDPLSSEQIATVKPEQALKWGSRLGRGLDYLHDNGVHFGGKILPDDIGVSEGQVVWADFNRCDHDPHGFIAERASDALALAGIIYTWITGKDHYASDPTLNPELEQLFAQVFTSHYIQSGLHLAQLLDDLVLPSTIAQAVDLHSGRRSHVGVVRSLNEDSLLVLELDRTQQSISKAVGVYVVADGMGGHSSGEVASGQIVDTIARQAFTDLMPSYLQNPQADLRDWLRVVVELANREVFNLRNTSGTDMGSTLVAALLVGNQAHITHIGDSRAYIINRDEIRQLTVDHSLVERMVLNHQISREEARRHPQRNVIYRTIGDKLAIEVDVAQHSLHIGDFLLLCSDGLSGMVEDQVMRKIVLETDSPQAACDELIRSANAAGGEDNISVIVVKIVEA